MPIHDWTRVDAGIFHDFHLSWIAELKRCLNRGLLPRDYYALAEQITGGLGPDVLTLERPVSGSLRAESATSGGIAVATTPPRARFHARTEVDIYAKKAKAVVIRHRSGHEVIAMIEIVSPGNKSSQRDLAAFVQKADQSLLAGIHLVIIDLFPPSKRDPQGIHRAIWGEDREGDFALPADKPLTCVSYIGYPEIEVYLDPAAVGDRLADMPLFLTPEIYVPLPLEATYQSAWDAIPGVWQEVLEAKPSGTDGKKTRKRRSAN
ncbi:MAG: DUF4058 family protein [Isosphaeraceae bacterium]